MVVVAPAGEGGMEYARISEEAVPERRRHLGAGRRSKEEAVEALAWLRSTFGDGG